MKIQGCLLGVFCLLILPNTEGALIAHYAFDEGSGSIVSDSSGNGRDMALIGGSWNASGQFGGSVNLGSTLARTGNQYASTIASLNTVTGNDITISFWAQTTSESVGSNPFYISNSSNSQGTRVAGAHLEWVNGITYWDAQWGSSSSNRIQGDLGSVSDRRHHYVFTYDGSNGDMEVYKDNVLAFSGSPGPGGAVDWASIRNFQLGAFSFANGNWAGEMDDFAIWDEVIDDSTRNRIFASGVAPAAIPEPSSSALLGLVGLALLLRRQR